MGDELTQSIMSLQDMTRYNTWLVSLQYMTCLYTRHDSLQYMAWVSILDTYPVGVSLHHPDTSRVENQSWLGCGSWRTPSRLQRYTAACVIACRNRDTITTTEIYNIYLYMTDSLHDLGVNPCLSTRHDSLHDVGVNPSPQSIEIDSQL